MHRGTPNQNFGWAMANPAHAAAPPPMTDIHCANCCVPVTVCSTGSQPT